MPIVCYYRCEQENCDATVTDVLAFMTVDIEKDHHAVHIGGFTTTSKAKRLTPPTFSPRPGDIAINYDGRVALVTGTSRRKTYLEIFVEALPCKKKHTWFKHNITELRKAVSVLRQGLPY